MVSSTEITVKKDRFYRTKAGYIVGPAEALPESEPVSLFRWRMRLGDGEFYISYSSNGLATTAGSSSFDLVEEVTTDSTMLADFDREIATITQRRGEVYGHPADDFRVTAALMEHFDHIEPVELRHALRMICVKLSRLVTSPEHLDSYVDIAGYARTAVMVIDRLKKAA